MTSIASVNSAALLILQQTGTSAKTLQPGSAETDILKIANGSSAVSSDTTKAASQAAAAAGKLAVDQAPEERAERGVIRISTDDGGLADRMALAATAKYERRSVEETIKILDSFDAFAIKHGRAPLHESIRSSLIKNGV